MPPYPSLPLNLQPALRMPHTLCALSSLRALVTFLLRLPARAALKIALPLALPLALSLVPAVSHADTLHFNCRGWMPIYLGSWVPINPDPSDFDMLSIEVNEQTRMTSFVLTMIGRANFATKISEAHVKGAIAYKQLMVDDYVEFIDFMLNRGTGEVIITALEKAYRRPHTLFKGKCIEVKSPFSKSKSKF